MSVSKRKGFTLIELMIVIVVIGVLAAMMMFSATEATTSAKATNIINNLQALKRAALAYYADNMDTVNKDPSGYAPNLSRVASYLDKPSNEDTRAKELEKEGYKFEYGANSSGRMTRWYAQYTITDSRIKAKLAGRAKSLGLLGDVDKGKVPADLPDNEEPEGSKSYDGTQDVVYLRIR